MSHHRQNQSNQKNSRNFNMRVNFNSNSNPKTSNSRNKQSSIDNDSEQDNLISRHSHRHANREKDKERQRDREAERSRDREKDRYRDRDREEKNISQHYNGYKRRLDRHGKWANEGYKYQVESIDDSEQEEDSGLIKFIEDKQSEVATQKDIIPWMSNKTSSIKETLLRFHNEIIQFYNYIKPSKKSHEQKLKKFQYIKGKILQIFPKVSVEYFGSFATQLYLPDGDIDVAVLTHGHYAPTEVYNRIDRFLEGKANSGLFTNVEYIRKSKVPLIKFQYEGIHFDISVDKTDGISQVKYVNKINQMFPQFKYLTLVFKCTLRIRNLADTYTGGIGSFLLSCMLLYYLKITIQKGHYYNLGQHVIQFIKFYAINEDRWKRKIILIKQLKQIDRDFDGIYLSCMSPQDGSHDIGKSAFKIKEVFGVLKNRCRYLLDKNFRAGESVLRVLVNPVDAAFRYLKDNEV